MPQAQVIGRVAVKVLPDTSDFRRKANAELGKIEKTLQITIGTKIDMSGASRDMLVEVRKINQRNRQMDSRKIRFATTISTDGMNQEITKALRALSARANNRQLKIKTNLVAATAVLAIDQGSLHDVKKALDDFRKNNDPLKIKVHPEMVLGATTVIEKRLAYLSRPRSVPLLPHVNSTAAAKAAATLAALSGARVLSGYIEDLAKSLSNLDKSVPIIGTVSEAIAGLGAWGLSAASNLFALSASLAQIAGAGLALPGILTGIGIGLGITMMAFKDMKKVMPEVFTQFKAMRKQMSTDFWAQAAKPIKALALTFLPYLATAASNVGRFWGSLATQLNTPFKTALGPMFDNLKKSIDIATSGTQAFAGIITQLGLTGSQYLPGLAQWFVNISKNFNTWLAAAASDGRLKGWIDSGIFALKELARVGSGIGSVLKGIADAAQKAGGSSLTDLANSLDRVAKVVNGPTFQTALVGALTAAHQAMANISSQAGPAFESFMLKLANVLTTVLPMAGQTIGTALDGIFKALSQPGVMNGVIAMFSGFSTAVSALSPALGPVGLALGSLMTVVGALASVLGPVLGVAFTALAQAVQILAPALLPVISVLGGGLAAAIGAIAPLVLQLVTAFASLVGGSVLPALSGIIAALVPALSSIAGAIGPLIPLVAAVLGPLIAGIGQLVAAVLPLVAAAFGKIAVAIAPVLTVLGQLVGFLVPILVPALTFLAGVLLDSIVGAVQGAATVIMGFVAVLQGLWMIVSGIFTGQWGQVWEGVKQVFAGVWQAILGIIEVAWNVGIIGAIRKGWVAIKALWSLGGAGIKAAGAAIWAAIKGGVESFFGAIKGVFTGGLNFLKSLWSGGIGFLRSYVLGQWNLIKAIFSAALGAVRGLVSGGINGIKSAFGGLRAIVSTVIGIWRSVNAAIGNAIVGAVRLVAGLPGKAKAALGNLGSLLRGAAASLINGFVEGIKSKFGDVKSTLTDLTNKLTSWKGPPKKDKTLLTPAGQQIIGGFIVGIKSRIPELRGALQSLTNALPQMVKTNIGKVNTVIGSMSRVLTSTQKAHLNAIVTQSQTMVTLVEAAQKRVADSLKAAQDRLSALQKESADYAAGVAAQVNATGNITSGDDHSYAAIWQNLVKARGAAEDFARVLDRLKKAGLGKVALDQLAQAGPDAGLAAGQSILNAGKKGISEINMLQSQLASAAAAAGKTTADAMFGQGIHIAEGLVAGLKLMQKPLEAQMVAIGKAMVAAIKRELKIKSPSRVFMEVGGFVGQGFADGISNKTSAVSDAMSAMAAVRPSGQSMKVSSAVDSALAGGGSGAQRVLHYHAAEGSSINAEEDLFAAAERSRMVNW